MKSLYYQPIRRRKGAQRREAEGGRRPRFEIGKLARLRDPILETSCWLVSVRVFVGQVVELRPAGEGGN